MRISVHLTFYIKNEKNINFKKLDKVIKNYLSISKKTFIFVHSNIKIKKKIKFVNFIKHNLQNKDPHKLSWMCRALMEKQKNYFDYFIYSEDDIIFNKFNFKAWVRLKDLCIKNKFNLGFLRIENLRNNHNSWSIDQPSILNQSLVINKQQYIVLKNPYCAMWIYDKKEFKNFTRSKFWNLNSWPGNNLYTNLKTREKSAIGWNGLNMKRYKASIVPMQNFKILKEFLIQHLDQKYTKFGPFSIKTNELISKKLSDYQEKNLLEVLLLRLKFFYKKYLRINLKNFL